MPVTRLSSVHLAELDWTDSSCLITYGPPPEKLFVSIEAVGLLQRPLLQRKETGLLRIICGSRRLKVCKELGLEPVPCQVLTKTLSVDVCLRMAVFDNLAHRVLNPVEKSLALAKMADHLSQADLMDSVMPLLDLEPSRTLFKRYLKLLRLEEVILDALATGRLHERIAFILTDFEREDRLAFFQLFEELPFSVSVQEELLELVGEISQRDRVTPSEVIAGREVRELCEDSKRPLRQRAQDLRRHLQGVRSPRLTARKKRFSMEIQQLGLPSGVRLLPPPGFEGPHWRLECTFGSGEDLAPRLDQMAELARQPAFQRVMESR